MDFYNLPPPPFKQVLFSVLISQRVSPSFSSWASGDLLFFNLVTCLLLLYVTSFLKNVHNFSSPSFTFDKTKMSTWHKVALRQVRRHIHNNFLYEIFSDSSGIREQGTILGTQATAGSSLPMC